MSFFRVILVFVILAPFAAEPASAQIQGSFELSARPKIDGKQIKLKRKRFYLFRGGMSANKALMDRLKAASTTSRDCFYCQMKASPEFVAWLRAEDCESPYCRSITADDIAKVPEFQVAYQKGLGVKQFKAKPEIAGQWVTTNLMPTLRDGFYRQRKSLIDTILAGTKPMQSTMTDSVANKAMFIDIPLGAVEPSGKATETFLYSNLVPIEIGSKSYLWACEVEIGGSKRATQSLKVPENDKPVSKCEVIVKDVPVCGAGSCGPK